MPPSSLPNPGSRTLIRWALNVALAVVGFLFLREGYYVVARKLNPHSNLNISCFVYRDVNRNGTYDMPDRPYAGLEVEMLRPDGSTVTATSNQGGFTNFVMALGDRSFDVRTPGEYSISAKPRDGWVVTSGNGEQNLRFKKVVGSPAGLAIEETIGHVGIAPVLTISGSIVVSPGAKVVAVPPGGLSQTASVDAAGKYSIPASTGDWELEFSATGSEPVRRQVAVGSYPVHVSRVDPTAPPPPIEARPNLRRVDFDDLTPSDTLFEIPSGYGGLNWKNWVATHHKTYGGDGYINATVTSEYMAYNSSGQVSSVWSDVPFDFVGTHVGVGWPDAEDGDVIIQAWRDGELVHKDRVRASTGTPVYFDAGYRGITRLEFVHEKYWQIVLDGFEYRTD